MIFKAYITKVGNNGKQMVELNGQSLFMDDFTYKKFMNNLSTQIYLRAFHKTMGSDKFSLIKLSQDGIGAFVMCETDSKSVINLLDSLEPNKNFNVFGLGNFDVSYGESIDKLLKYKYIRKFLKFLVGKTITKHRYIYLKMTYNV